MMRSLLGQLLVAHSSFKRTTIEQLKHIDQFNIINIDSLCEMYFRLIMQLPAQETVFCTIDGMTLHEETRSRCREALITVQTLVCLTECCASDAHCTTIMARELEVCGGSTGVNR